MSAPLPARTPPIASQTEGDIAGNRFAKVLILLLREQCACRRLERSNVLLCRSCNECRHLFPA